jgi:hypothetical protein
MTEDSGRGGPAYEVVLPGVFGAPYVAMFSALGVRRTVTSSTFRCTLPPERDVRDLVRTLREQGVAVLEVREVWPPSTRSA